MLRLVLSVFCMVFTLGRIAHAQEDIVWVQIEAQPSLSEANTEIRRYASQLEDVNGFTLGGGWYGIALGPYTREDAETVLTAYRQDGLIPRDSYITFSSTFQSQFWPVGANLLNIRLDPEDVTDRTASSVSETTSVTDLPPAQQTETLEVQSDPIELVQLPDETPREARASESRLSRDEKKDLQTWLQWAGFYSSAIDGAFGRGTRASMSAWQAANGHETTGVLTTAQRAQLNEQYNAVLEGLDLQAYTSLDAGIEVLVPLGVVEKSVAEYPFVQFTPTGDIDAQVVLISQAGDQITLAGLYDVMQTLELVPLDGPRELRKNSFVMVGEDASHISHTEVSLKSGEIKGFTLVWPAGDEERRRRVLSEMRKSFARIAGVMDPAIGADALQDLDLLSGLEIRRPKLSRSGFYINGRGTVVTTAEVVDSCQRITLENEYDAELVGVNEQLGIAVLRPASGLAPISVAAFSETLPRLKSEIAVSGYSFEGVLGAPTVTFGTLADLSGLQGETELTRLALAPLPGDAGGPVFDISGSVVGMLLPAPSDSGRQLPPDVSFAARGDVIRSVLDEEGITTESRAGFGNIAPEDLTTLAGEITVLVSCW